MIGLNLGKEGKRRNKSLHLLDYHLEDDATLGELKPDVLPRWGYLA